MRLAQQLGALACGVGALGLPNEAVPAIIRSVALDSMPEARRAVLQALALDGHVTADGVHVVVWCKHSRRLNSHGHSGRRPTPDRNTAVEPATPDRRHTETLRPCSHALWTSEHPTDEPPQSRGVPPVRGRP